MVDFKRVMSVWPTVIFPVPPTRKGYVNTRQVNISIFIILRHFHDLFIRHNKREPSLKCDEVMSTLVTLTTSGLPELLTRGEKVVRKTGLHKDYP